jgi:phospholipase C
LLVPGLERLRGVVLLARHAVARWPPSDRQQRERLHVTREVTTEAGAALPFANSRTRGPIKHIVFVVKENRTYDQVFGQRRGARGDAANTTLGLGMRVASKDGTRVLERVDVTPNHHALADA